MSASWLQFALAIAVMYSVVAAAGYWGKRKRAQREAHPNDRHDR